LSHFFGVSRNRVAYRWRLRIRKLKFGEKAETKKPVKTDGWYMEIWNTALILYPQLALSLPIFQVLDLRIEKRVGREGRLHFA
jgi:hypothetical protein